MNAGSRKLLLLVATSLATPAGLGGCKSPPGFAANAEPDQAVDGQSVKPVSFREEDVGPAVTLEPDAEAEAPPTGWRRLLQPFSSRKERIPLPVSPKKSDDESDPSFNGF